MFESIVTTKSLHFGPLPHCFWQKKTSCIMLALNFDHLQQLLYHHFRILSSLNVSHSICLRRLHRVMVKTQEP